MKYSKKKKNKEREKEEREKEKKGVWLMCVTFWTLFICQLRHTAKVKNTFWKAALKNIWFINVPRSIDDQGQQVGLATSNVMIGLSSRMGKSQQHTLYPIQFSRRNQRWVQKHPIQRPTCNLRSCLIWSSNLPPSWPWLYEMLNSQLNKWLVSHQGVEVTQKGTQLCEGEKSVH